MFIFLKYTNKRTTGNSSSFVFDRKATDIKHFYQRFSKLAELNDIKSY